MARDWKTATEMTLFMALGISLAPVLAWAKTPKGLEIVPVAISRVFLDYGCGATPVPDGIPQPTCPPLARLRLTFMGNNCSADDFEIRVRQKEAVQLVTVYRKSASGCVIPVMNWRTPFSGVEAWSGQILPGKPLRLTNPLPVFESPRP